VSPSAEKLRISAAPMLPTSARPAVEADAELAAAWSQPGSSPIPPLHGPAPARGLLERHGRACGFGALKMAIMASPMNCTTVPPLGQHDRHGYAKRRD